MMYQNIISDSMNFVRYWIIKEYDCLDDAKANLEKDTNDFCKKYRGTYFYKMCYPFSYATIKAEE